MTASHISVWRIQDTPEQYRRFCPAGWLNTDGNSSITAVWLAHVPSGSGWVGWLEGRDFACCDVFEHQLDDGSYIAVGGHYAGCAGEEHVDLPVDNERVIRVWRFVEWKRAKRFQLQMELLRRQSISFPEWSYLSSQLR